MLHIQYIKIILLPTDVKHMTYNLTNHSTVIILNYPQRIKKNADSIPIV